MTLKSYLQQALILTASFVLFITASGPASAQFSISSPKVEKGELEIETHGSVQSGLPAAEDNDEEGEAPIRHGHEISVGYGFTDFWKAELGLGFQKPQGESLEATSLEIENTFQLGHIQRWDVTIGVLAAVSFGVGGADEPDAFEFGPLIQFGEKRSLILNAIFEKTFGENREEGIGFEYAGQVKFPVARNISLGAEAFGEIENIQDAPSFDETELRVGPALFFTFGDDDDDDAKGGDDDDDKGLKMAAKEPEIGIGLGLLFGATDATPDMTVKWDLEIAF
jgi:hypothetical protein